MRFLVFQHIACEHPGSFRDVMREEGVEWDAVELDEGENIPELERYQALIVMGGPMDVWETDEHPWLVPEKEAIRTWVQDLKRPYLGVCLGHQLLADVTGGACRKMEQPDVGITEVFLTEEGQEDPICLGLDQIMPMLQWHGVEVERMPEDSTLLGLSQACGVEAFKVGKHAYGIQGHAEITRDTVREWGEIPEYAAAFEKVKGEGALAAFEEECRENLEDFERTSRVTFRNFLDIVRY